jgi:hypothetical protein
MGTLDRKVDENLTNAAQAEIGRALREEYEKVVPEPAPSYFSHLLMRFDGAVFLAKIKARVDNLRQGLKSPKKD